MLRALLAGLGLGLGLGLEPGLSADAGSVPLQEPLAALETLLVLRQEALARRVLRQKMVRQRGVRQQEGENRRQAQQQETSSL